MVRRSVFLNSKLIRSSISRFTSYQIGLCSRISQFTSYETGSCSSISSAVWDVSTGKYHPHLFGAGCRDSASAGWGQKRWLPERAEKQYAGCLRQEAFQVEIAPDREREDPAAAHFRPSLRGPLFPPFLPGRRSERDERMSQRQDDAGSLSVDRRVFKQIMSLNLDRAAFF